MRPRIFAKFTCSFAVMTRRLLFSSLREENSRRLVITAKEQVNLAKIRGRIQWVNSFPDYKVKIVNSFADLHVRLVASFPDDPGEWQIVNSFPNFKIQIVDSFPDFTIKYVDSFPGVKR
jgi:hypothetical protein